MGKAYTKGAKRRAKKMLAGLPDIEPIKKRQPNGQHRKRAESPSDPRKTALQARAAHFSGKNTKEAMAAVSGQHISSQLGMVIQAESGDKHVSKVWPTFQAWCMAETSYRRRYLGQGEFAKCASIQMEPDRFEADNGHTVDLRDDEQKDKDAINAWMCWQGYLGHLSATQRSALHNARLERAQLWRDRKPTQRGLYTLEALNALHAVVAAKG